MESERCGFLYSAAPVTGILAEWMAMTSFSALPPQRLCILQAG